MSERCEYLLPPFDYALSSSVKDDCSDHMGQCLLAQDHAGTHLICFDTAVIPRYLEWEYDPAVCECTDEDLNEEMCQCFSYDYVSEEQARCRIKKEGPTR
jgi:hypothetical protein